MRLGIEKSRNLMTARLALLVTMKNKVICKKFGIKMICQICYLCLGGV